MKFIKYLFFFVVLLLQIGCRQQDYGQQDNLMSHKTQLPVSPLLYQQFWANLDIEMTKFGLVRTGPAITFDKRTGKDAFFGVYHVKGDNTKWFLSAHDLGKVGVVNINVYAKTIKEEKLQLEALDRVNSVLAIYGGGLEKIKINQNK
jgi:hypothetical protein